MLAFAVFEAGIWEPGLRAASTTLGARTPRDAVAGVEAPMALASLDSASFLAFSLIAFCFSSSLARIGTRSSGIGLLSFVTHNVMVCPTNDK